MRNRKIVIGDVHGCLDELRELIGKIGPSQDDHLFFVGDLIDKGPFSSQVVDLVQSIRRNTCRVTLLLGNHEEKLLRWVGHEQRCLRQERMNPMFDRFGALAKLASDLRDDQLETLASALLWIRISGSGFERPLMLVHAGIEPSLTDLGDNEQHRANVNGKRWRELEGLIRVRFVNEQGMRIRLGDHQLCHRFWADVYDGRFGFVVYGHEPTETGFVRENTYALGIDLGCVYGGYLAAVIFHDDRPTWETVTVKSLKRYDATASVNTD